MSYIENLGNKDEANRKLEQLINEYFPDDTFGKKEKTQIAVRSAILKTIKIVNIQPVEIENINLKEDFEGFINSRK